MNRERQLGRGCWRAGLPGKTEGGPISRTFRPPLANECWVVWLCSFSVAVTVGALRGSVPCTCECPLQQIGAAVA